MNELIIKRSADIISAEINSIKNQTKIMVLQSSIEIGKRLVEAKEIVDHGEWGIWLKSNVDYSTRTATNLMRIFREYGNGSNALIDSVSNRQTFADLSYSQAVALLGIQTEKREEFLQENDVENMSARELKKAIEEKKNAELEKEKAIRNTEEAKKNEELIRKAHNDSLKEIERLKKNIKKYEKDQKSIDQLKIKIKNLEKKELEIKPGATPEEVEKIKAEYSAEYERELAVLKSEKESAVKRIKQLEVSLNSSSNGAALKYKVYFDEMVKVFNRLYSALKEIKESDKETYMKYKKATETLIEKLIIQLSDSKDGKR